MKRIVINPYEIKLVFDSKTENPSRLFHSFAELIDGISRFDTSIAKTVNTKISSKIVLDDIEKGSLIAKLWNELVISEDGQIDDIKESNDIENYIEDCRIAGLELLRDGRTEYEDLEKLAEKIDQNAVKNNLKGTFNYQPPDLLEISKDLNIVSESTKKLTENESFTIKSRSKEVSEIDKNIPKFDIESVEKALTSEQLENETTVFYKIKKPDFLGESQWEFKFGTKTIRAKILDEKWLSEFYSGKNIVIPGDSLKVKVKQTSCFNKNGYLISDKIEIIEILEIKHNS